MYQSMDNLLIIAEASGNHNQRYDQAEALIRAAAQAGADVIKFQTFTPAEIAADGVVIPRGHDPQHDAWLARMRANTLRDLFRYGGLPRALHRPLKAVADTCDIEFCSTPFSVDAAKFLVEEVGVKRLKIASGDLTFTPLLEYAASTGLPVILSTGGATMAEINTAINDHLWEPYVHGRLTLMHCRSIYPCLAQYANLRSIVAMGDAYSSAEIGWSDHTLSHDVIPLMAAMCGATVIEKHLKLYGDTESVDAGHSLGPYDFLMMVKLLRDIPTIMGTLGKEPHPLEAHDRLWARRDSADWLRPTQAAREGQWQ